MNEKEEAGDLRVGVGVNTGRVVAGAIGGGGRLNFSVIGDAVNIAARAESATRELDRDVLITAETAELLGAGIEAKSEGSHQLKGVAEAVELFSVQSALASLDADRSKESRLDPEPILAAAGRVRRGIFRRRD